jgi:hypothetical protein
MRQRYPTADRRWHSSDLRRISLDQADVRDRMAVVAGEADFLSLFQ